MEFETKSHRFGLAIADELKFKEEWEEIQDSIESITDEQIVSCHNNNFSEQKSISKAINRLIHDNLTQKGWHSESPIFNDPHYENTRWRLDFAKDYISVEVAFNHGEAIAWNLLKPVLASELNHVKKKANTSLGVIIMANEAMKEAGGFDGAVGSYEKAIRYLKPLQNQLSCPIILIGLHAPMTFKVEHVKVEGRNRAKFTTI
ncbi:hypothetical protein H8D29_07255 [PVC group bacterium]|nr:hypothetical protein [PVC group bacterium]